MAVNLRTISTILCTLLVGLLATSGFAQEDELPAIPTLEEIREQRILDEPGQLEMEFGFHIGVIGDFEKTYETGGGTEVEVKTPMILIDPAKPERPRVFAKNFPARIAGVSENGTWVIGITPSYAVEGTSGSPQREAAVSLNLAEGGLIRTLDEFPLFSKFQAVFSPEDWNMLYYCINEPGSVNEIQSLNLRKDRRESLAVEGNRFNLYGFRQAKPLSLWVSNPNTAIESDLMLVDSKTGALLHSVDFPGVTEIIASPDGESLLAVVKSGAEASIGYYTLADSSFHQVPGLVLTSPSIKWVHSGKSVIALESTNTRDRFLWIDLESGEARELYSAYFKVTHWDLSPDDDALVFMTGDHPPTLFVVPTDPTVLGVARISLTDVTNVSWVGCIVPPTGGGSWIDTMLNMF